MPTTCGDGGTCIPDTPGPPAGPPMGAACSGTCLGTSCVAFLVSGATGGQCQHADGLACISSTCQPLLAQGQHCTTEYQCADPLACNGSTCVARLPNGSPCSPPTADTTDNPCQPGSGCVSGACAALKTNGQSCASSDECLENNCLQGQCARLGAQPICGG
jgi:hypothetical protein